MEHKKIILPARAELTSAVADIIAEVCHCDRQALLEGRPFAEVIEHYDSLAMLEILLGIETQYDVSTAAMLPADYRSEEDLAEVFPKNLVELIDKIYFVAQTINAQ